MTHTPARARRPRDRRERIIAAAAEQFRAAGYHNVGIVEIAEAVGITSGALYRHFDDKEDLLLATVEDAIDRLRAVWARDYPGLDALFEVTCALVIERPDAAVLWGREIAHLPADVQHKLREELLSAIKPLRSAIASARPELSPDAVDLLLWATAAVIASVGYHSVKLENRRFRTLLARVCRSVYSTPGIPARDQSPSSPVSASATGQLPTSRPEAILVAATRLFSERGYQAVSVDDIGAAAGITGATVYHHYANKSAILAAALRRCLQAMFFDLSSALSTPSPGEALDRLLGFLVRTAIEHGHTIGALLNEIPSLPAEEREPLRQAELDYAAEWTALLTRHRPALTDAEAQVLVYATMATINSLLATPHLRVRPTLHAELLAIGRAILATESGPG